MTIPTQKKGLRSGIQAVKVQTREQVVAEVAREEENLRGFLNYLDTDGDMDEAREMMEAMAQLFQSIKEDCPPLHRLAWPRPEVTFDLSPEGFGSCYKAARAKGLPPKEALTEAINALGHSMHPPQEEPIP